LRGGAQRAPALLTVGLPKLILRDSMNHKLFPSKSLGRIVPVPVEFGAAGAVG
jgi:hypothetical protein